MGYELSAISVGWEHLVYLLDCFTEALDTVFGRLQEAVRTPDEGVAQVVLACANALEYLLDPSLEVLGNGLTALHQDLVKPLLGEKPHLPILTCYEYRS